MKEHPFFNGIDWNVVYQQKYPPPLIPPRGEVNAADAFDIGSFDEEDTKGMCTQCTNMSHNVCHVAHWAFSSMIVRTVCKTLTFSIPFIRICFKPLFYN